MNEQTSVIGALVAALLILREMVVFLMSKMKRNGISGLHNDVASLKTDVAVIKQDVHWLKETLKR